MGFKANLKKGSVGERLVLSHLRKMGYILYTPPEGMRHPVDVICFSKHNYQDAFIAEVKTKPRMRRYNATGIDCEHFMVYDMLQRSMGLPVFIFFVDFSLRRIYGNYLDELIKPHSQIEGKRVISYPRVISPKGRCIVLFGLSRMVDIAPACK